MEENIALLKKSLQLDGETKIRPGKFVISEKLPHLHYTEGYVRSNVPVHCYVGRYYTEFRMRHTSYSTNDHYLFGLLKLEKQFPHTIIYPEGLAEKISDIFAHAELDFSNNKKFSRRFYTLTKDKPLLKSLLSSVPLNDLAPFRSMELELKDNEVFFRHSRKPIDRKETEAFCELAQTVVRVFG